ncbi:chemotaxis protein CheC [Paraburkholderia unamae]|jgi:chemotaxis protein CheC|uniref:CheC inhibitor of MCP methylation n=1 Tax=Paraburkholderia unamae TaxID=219649 RepID=A0ABX5KIU4_9BURK|nr:chemotaxis protein CheC [Paraburkholderia unamae]PVX78989.1 CheC inhibitor of MCP methylation [Paraburkholderia unamae]RAR64944.1 CheC inhibitor of MCP methylation [Paraburkholderia unamae]CAG9265857.1 Chemotaxis protein CheC -- inhibitor of MCP methylation [Paraburkholderia unamae]
MPDRVFTELQRDALQEIANLGMGQAATRLSGLLNAFIELSVPRVRVVAVSEAAAALREMTGIDGPVAAVRQGFRSEIKGEALVICRSGEIAELGSLVGGRGGVIYAPDADDTLTEEELMFDVANALTGACVSSMLDQLGRMPVFSQPGLLGEAIMLDEVFQPGLLAWDVALLVEVNFALEDQRFRAHLVMLMAEESIHVVSRAIDALLHSL